MCDLAYYSDHGLRYGWEEITHLVIEDGVTSIGKFACYTFINLTDVVIPESVTSIGNYAFLDCTSLKEVVIPDKVTTIDDCAFYGCSGLMKVTLPESITAIGEDVFRDCSSLTEFTIPDSVTSIGGGAFFGCSGLTEIVIPNSVTYIGGHAFRECNGMTEIVIPDSVTTLEYCAFLNCINLEKVVLSQNITSIDQAVFDGCSSLKEITIPNSVTSIGTSAFAYCSSLTEIVIPEHVTSLGSSVFSNCSSLTKITIPESVTVIGYDAFKYCSSLTEITFSGDAPTFELDLANMPSDAFWGVTATVYYPANNPTWTSDVMQQYRGTITWVPYGVPAVGQNGYDLILSVEDNLLNYQLLLPDTENADEAYYVRIMDDDNTCMYSCSVWSDTAYKDSMWALTESGTYTTVEVRSYTDEDTVLARWKLDTPIVVTAGATTLPTTLNLKAVEQTEDGSAVAYQLVGADANLAYSIYDAAQSCVYTLENDNKWGAVVWMSDSSEYVELYSLRADQSAVAYTLQISAPSVVHVPAYVPSGPVITKQPENVEVSVDEYYCITVEAEGEELKYQWYFRNADSSTWYKSSVRDNTYDDVMNKTRVGREVYCVITDADGNSVTTETVKLIGIPSVKLEIVTQPTDSTAKLGERYCVTVEAKGDDVRYQWYFRNAGSDVWYKSKIKDNTYDDIMTGVRHNREIYCVITDAYGNKVTSECAKLIGTAAVELKLLNQPSDDYASMGEQYCVTVEAQGDDLKYQWYFRNAGSDKWYKSSITDNTYDDVMNKTRAGREVYCVITDALGNKVTTDVAKLVLIE